MNLLIQREPLVRLPGYEPYTPGILYINNVFFCYTLEDEVRKGDKVYGRTAIPAGFYEVKNTLSNRFKRVLPEVLSVPNFSGVRFHGGNTATDSLGCILVGRVRTKTGIAQSASTVNELIRRISSSVVTLTIKDVS